MKRLFAIALLFVVGAFSVFAQTPAPFPAITLPTSVAGFATYNQLSSPRWTMGLSALYPFGTGALGLYGSSTADIYPKKIQDPTTGINFYSLDMSFRQGLHKYIFGTGRWAFLVGGDLGPSFGTITSTTSGTSVNFSSSIIATTVYQLSPAFCFVMPLRLLYVSGTTSPPQSKWNPVLEVGIAINLKYLSKPQIVTQSK
jgi:hypothetical protein